MHVGVITYQTGHLKTWQITTKLLCKGHRVTLYAFPFFKRPQIKTRRFQDRPDQLIDLDIERFCSDYNVGYVKMGGWDEEYLPQFGRPGTPEGPDIYLHCTAKIIPASFLMAHTVLNCHPGLLTHNRGLDAFKWCIVNGWPIGNTLHIIDPEIDGGCILHRMRLPIFDTDDLNTVCRRSYEFEVDLLANFESHLWKSIYKWEVGTNYLCSHKKIPVEIDENIESIFNDRRIELIALSQDFTVQSHPADGWAEMPLILKSR